MDIRNFPFHKFPAQRKLLSNTFLVNKFPTNNTRHKTIITNAYNQTDSPNLGFPTRAKHQVLHASYTTPCATCASPNHRFSGYRSEA